MRAGPSAPPKGPDSVTALSRSWHDRSCLAAYQIESYIYARAAE